MTGRHSFTGIAIAAALACGAMRTQAVVINASEDGSIQYYIQDYDAVNAVDVGYNTAPAAQEGRLDDRWAIPTASTTTGVIVGTAGTALQSRYAAVHEVFFVLPERPAGFTVDTASSLAVYLTSKMGTPTFNIDVWGLGYKAAATYSTSDYMDVDGDDNPKTGGGLSAHAPQRREVLFSDTTDLGAAYGIASRIKVIDDLFTSASTDAAYASDGGAALAAYLNSLYDAGAVAGDVVVFRLNPDAGLTPTSTNLRYNLGALETTQPAQLTINFVAVPEPAGLGLLALGGLVVGFRRR